MHTVKLEEEIQKIRLVFCHTEYILQFIWKSRAEVKASLVRTFKLFAKKKLIFILFVFYTPMSFADFYKE